MDMTPLQVRYSWGRFLPRTESGAPSTIIYTQWNSRHEGFGCHAPVGITYHQTPNISNTLLDNKIVDHSDVVGASTAGAAPTTSPFST